MPRVPLLAPRTPFARFAGWMSRRRFGAELEPLAVVSHHPGVLRTVALLEFAADRQWRSLDPGLRTLAVAAAAGRLGCPWCMDFGYWEAYSHRTLDMDKLRNLHRWRAADCYSDLERAVIEYAEAMSDTPVTVTDEMVADLRRALTDRQVVELTSWVALEAMRSRTYLALGVRAQGFADRCELPAPDVDPA